MNAQRFNKLYLEKFLIILCIWMKIYQAATGSTDDEFTFPNVRIKCAQTYEEFLKQNSEIYIGLLAGYGHAKVSPQ
jgi:hypothetical protein